MEKFFVQNFGCRATQADGAALEPLLAGKGFASTGERAGADLVVLNTCTVTSSADDDVRQTIRRVHRENPGGADPGHGLLRAARTGGIGVDGRGGVGGGQFAQNPDRGDCDGGALSWQYSHRRYLRTARLSVGAGGRRGGRAHAPQSENSGWVQQSLLVLHYPVRARTQPQRARRTGDRTGARAGRALSRDRAERNQSGAMGQGTGQPDAAGRPAAPRCWRRPVSNACASARWSRWISPTTCCT